ncbi:MAG: hypothetical protein AAFP20_14830 [Cyanobacteria bacterium J06614_10]
MLTSYQYLLGGCVAVSCVTGALTSIYIEDSSSHASQETLGPLLSEAVDVAYRGSGRLDSTPNRGKSAFQSARAAFGASLEASEQSLNGYRSKVLLSHRGSGRIVPSLI